VEIIRLNKACIYQTGSFSTDLIFYNIPKSSGEILLLFVEGTAAYFRVNTSSLHRSVEQNKAPGYYLLHGPVLGGSFPPHKHPGVPEAQRFHRNAAELRDQLPGVVAQPGGNKTTIYVKIYT